MEEYNRYFHTRQDYNDFSSIIIIPDAFYTHSSFASTNCNAKHLLILNHLLLSCWLKADRPKLDSLLQYRPMKAKMLQLNYIALGKVFDMSKDQLIEILKDLEATKLLSRVQINNKWYILLSEQAFSIFLNNNKSKKHRINKGNVIPTSWFKLLKTDGKQTDFVSALVLADIVYYARVFERKAPDYSEELNDSDDSISHTTTTLVSKSAGLVPYFEHNHFYKKFPFLDKRTIDRAFARLVENDIIFIEIKKFIRNRKVIKKLYIAPNYKLISKGVNGYVVDFTFKIPEHLNNDQLTSFYKNTPPTLYNKKYNNKTIIYPELGELNISSFSIQKEGIGKKRRFMRERSLYDLALTLKRLYKPYFSSFGYPIAFCTQLLHTLARKYPNAKFMGENQFIKYFRTILAQERKPSWQVRSKGYFEKAYSLAELSFDKLSSSLREKLNKLTTAAGKSVEELPNLLASLAIRNAKHLFACASSFLSYMKQVLAKLKSKEEMRGAYKALPRVSINEISQYLNVLEGSYYKTGPDEHLKRKLAATLPMTVAYYLLNSCNFTTAHLDCEQNFIIPSKNACWAELLRSRTKQIIKEQISAVYGQIKAIKFAPFWIKAKPVSKQEKSNKSALNKEELGLTEYQLFQIKRREEEQRQKELQQTKITLEAKEVLASKCSSSEYNTGENTAAIGLLEKYKQESEQVQIDKQSYLSKGGAYDLATNLLFTMPSFKEWMQLQELLGLV